MFDTLKASALGAVAAVALAVAAPAAQAATTLVDGGVYTVPTDGTVFEGTMDLNLACGGSGCTTETATGPGSISATFHVLAGYVGSGLGQLALTEVGADRFTGLTAQWIDFVTGDILSSLSIPTGGGYYTLSTAFNGANLSQVLKLSWDDLLAPGSSSTSSAVPAVRIEVAPIPLPATGLLLLGAVGATAMLRRRKNVAA